MSNELKQAAWRLREHEAIDHFNHPMSCPYFNCDSCDGNAILKDRALLSDAYLAEHPPDDDEPVTEEWLELVGFTRNGIDIGWGFSLNLYQYVDGDITYTDADGYGDQLPLPYIETRSDVRLLCKLLGIELKEPTNGS